MDNELGRPDSTQVIESPRAVFQPLPANLVEDEVLPQLDIDVLGRSQETSVPLDADFRPSKRRRLDPQSPEAGCSTSSHSTSSNSAPRALLATWSSSQPLMSFPASNSSRYGKNVYVYASRPPTSAELIGSTDEHAIPRKIYRDPWYSRESDAPEQPREYASLVFHLKGGEGIGNLEDWKSGESAPAPSASGEPARPLDPTGVGGWEYASMPPTVRQVRQWLKEQNGRLDARAVRVKDSSQVPSILLRLRHLR